MSPLPPLAANESLTPTTPNDKTKTATDNIFWSSHRTAKYTKLKLCKRSYLRIQNYQIVR